MNPLRHAWTFVVNRITDPRDSEGMRLVKIATVLVNVAIVVFVVVSIARILWAAR